MSAITISNEREIQPMQLSIEQLYSLKQQHEEELQELQNQLESLSGARSKFFNAKNSLNEIGKSSDGAMIYVPLSPSLYVPGSIIESNKVIVELGTNYFCDKTISEAQQLIERKLALINQSIETIEGVGINKKKNLSQLIQVIQYKMQMAKENK